MKKPWLLILAGIILTALLGLWLYIFFGGDDAKENVFSALNFGDTGGEESFLEELFDDVVQDNQPSYLRQLSLRRVIGYSPLEQASSTPSVYAAEAGTGHIYKINVADGAEERVSNITIPQAREAIFSNDATLTAIKKVGDSEITLISLASTSGAIEIAKLQTGAFSFSFTDDNTLLYASKRGSSVEGFAYNIESGKTEAIFTIPFREAVILWGDTVAGDHYTYPKPASTLEGYLYKVTKAGLERLPISGFELSAMASDSFILYSKIDNGLLETYIYNAEYQDTDSIRISTLAEKCTISTKYSVLLCGRDELLTNGTSVNGRYRGEIFSSDSLWMFSIKSSTVIQTEDVSAISNRPLDIQNFDLFKYGLFFINRLDMNLWIYDKDLDSIVNQN